MTTSTTPAATKNTGRDLALIAVFAAFIAVCALLPAIPVGPLGVPITLQTLAIYTAALILGGRRATLAVTLYLVAGLLGLPVFARGGAGFGVIATPSFGYLLGFIPGALLAGSLSYSFWRKRSASGKQWLWQALAALAGFAVIQIFGIGGMMVNASLSFGAAASAAALYIPGDLIKCAAAVMVALAVHRAFPQLTR
ncbi:MAG: biotin transporter BioY [Rothia sp. (in: high G+C Gram-positive bacteria)]|nr:biotin transporter BioY [Rothia sp. (in: high G+C Gram-positive bacteria)]